MMWPSLPGYIFALANRRRTFCTVRCVSQSKLVSAQVLTRRTFDGLLIIHTVLICESRYSTGPYLLLLLVPGAGASCLAHIILLPAVLLTVREEARGQWYMVHDHSLLIPHLSGPSSRCSGP